jgi:hypothetical protein
MMMMMMMMMMVGKNYYSFQPKIPLYQDLINERQSILRRDVALTSVLTDDFSTKVKIDRKSAISIS